MSETKTRIYPLYLAIDSSGSMEETLNPFDSQRRIDFARNFPLGILQLYEESQDLVAHLRISVFTFNRTAHLELPLSPVTSIRDMNFDWEPKGKTFFANLFDTIQNRIQEDKAAFAVDYDMHNPAIVVVTDGIPSNVAEDGETPERRRSSQRSLAEMEGFNQPVQIVMFGIGMASQDILSTYATHPSLAIKADPALPIAKQMESLVLQLKHTIRQSLLNDVSGDASQWIQPIDPNADRDDLWYQQ